MKTALVLATLAFSFSALSRAAEINTADNSCSIDAGWVECMEGGSAQYDTGCSVDCGAKKADCISATTLEFPNPNGAWGNCELIPSACNCD